MAAVKLADMQGAPCQCEACVLAGVSDRPTRRDPYSGRILHGRDLRRWWDARAKFLALKQTVQPKVMR